MCPRRAVKSVASFIGRLFVSTPNEHVVKTIQEFVSLIAPIAKVYPKALFGFVALSEPEGLVLCQGHIVLPTGPNLPPPMSVKTASICACVVSLVELKLDCEKLIFALLGDGVETPVGNVRFPGTAEGPYPLSASLQRFPSNFYTANAHPLSLSLSLSMSSSRFANRLAEFQNDLRACADPFDSLMELATELGLPSSRWSESVLHVTAHNVVAVDLERHIVNRSVKLALLAAHGLDRGYARLGYRVQTVDGKVIQRRAVDAGELYWSAKEQYDVGEVDVSVPQGAIIQCFASYKGYWQHQGWVTTPGTFINLRRVAYEAFDPGLANLTKYLSDPRTLRQDARLLELGVATLLYMKGFAPSPFAGKFSTDAPDLLASTPSGNIAVVECTTGAIDSEGKLSKLLNRTALLAERLRVGGYAHVRCLPVIVTTLSRDEITDISLAAENGIIVVSSEDLAAAVNETMVPGNADRLFDEQWRKVHPTQDSLFQENNGGR